jgi:hypothetical protein
VIYAVTIPLDVNEPNRIKVARLLGEVLSDRFSRLKSRVLPTDAGVEVVLRVECETEATAKRKGLYWLERATKLQKALVWNGRMTGEVTVDGWI